jgi:signal transduction histidine kinase
MTLAENQYSDGPHSTAAFSQLLSIREEVMALWEREVRARVDGTGNMKAPALERALPMLFDDIAMALALNAPIPMREDPTKVDSPASHGMARARHTSFGPEQIVHEYQIFREAIATAAEGRVDIDSKQWKLIDQAINDATRLALRVFTGVQDEARRRVAAALSHDMRTPLAVIASGAQLLSITPNVDLARRAASKIESNAARLTNMVGDLLDALTFQGGAKLALRLSSFDAFELVKEVRDQYVSGGNWTIDFEADGEPVRGYWCRDAMRRALENLVNNAVKYGNGGSVQMSARENRGRLMLSVRNTGAPIALEQRDRIFEYLRRDQNISSIPGWGIGLPFVKAVAEGHGGDVSVDSSAERGTTFFIYMPLDCRPHVEHVGSNEVAT